MRKFIKIFIVIIILSFVIPIIDGYENRNKINFSNIINGDEAPEPPKITGPRECKLHTLYTYEIISEDPQCDDICYIVRCSDLPLIYISKFCESGFILKYNHTWDDFFSKTTTIFYNSKSNRL